MHKFKFPPYPKTFSTECLLVPDSYEYNMPSADQDLYCYLDVPRLPTPLIKLSPYHEIFYNEWKLNPQRSDYSIVFDNEMQGELDPVRLDQALCRLSADYFLLQSSVKEIGGIYYWVTRPNKHIKLDYFDMPLSDHQLLAYVNTPFDLTADALLRVALVKLADKHFRFVIVMHHLIMDGAKADFMTEAIPRYYNDETYRFKISIEEQCRRLNKLAERHIRWLEDTEEDHQNFWRSQLVDVPGVSLQFLKRSAENQDIEGNSIGEYRFTFNAEVSKKIRHVAKKNATTPYLLSMSVLAILLHRHTHQKEFGLSMSVAIPEGAEFIYGAQVSTCIFSYQFDHATTLAEVIKQTKDYFKLIKSENHYYYPFQKISKAVIHKDLMDVGFTQRNVNNDLFHFQGTFNEKVNSSLHIDLAQKFLFLQDIKDNLIHYRVMYQKHCIDSEIFLNFINTYKRLFVEMLDDLSNNKEAMPVSTYSLVDDTQRDLITHEWNNTESPYPNKTLHQLFEEQAEKTPKAIALAYENATWSYSQLNEASNQLAHYLRNNFLLQPDDIVGLCLKPGYHMIMALWAVLKSGAAYLPIDRAHPDDRISYLINDTKAKVILTDRHNVNRFSRLVAQNKFSVINLDAQQTKFELLKQLKENLKPVSLPNHLAYVIYTSGTQGQPKGVLLEHRSVVNYVTFVISDNELSETSVWAQYASFSFDCSVLEIYPVLLSGGKLCVVKEEYRIDCKKVNDFFHQNEVTFAFLPTPFAELFFELKNTSLKKLMVAGSKLSKYVDAPYSIINAYGPTEATVHATQFSLDRAYENIPIGKPLNNVKCYVVDTCLNLLPIGTIGELLIGGEGLARGYLNLPEVTAQKFICNPFQSEQEKAENKNTRLYRTGDLARWLADGNLEYIGRNDDQIKIRGHRIELSEIEYGLMQYPGIQQAAVIAANKTDKPNEKHIAAYYVAQAPLDHVNLKEHLSKQLPEYMLPSAFMHVQKMPLATSGKINKRALPMPQWACVQPYVHPSTLLEGAVCAAYAKILGLKENQVGVHHDFFELGGDSLSAIRLTFLLGHHIKINATDIFKLKTPAKLVLQLPPAKESFLKNNSQIKLFYQNKISFAFQDIKTKSSDQNTLRQYRDYLEQTKKLDPDIAKRHKMQSVFLTGTTGFLGCHLLATLLEETSYIIYLPVRASSDASAFERLNKKFKHYIKIDLENKLSRIKVFAAHLGKENLGLEQEQYEAMANQVGSIIHCASLVKYFGHDEEFYQSNIQPTIQLLEFARLTANKDFHYISTVGIAFDGHVTNSDYSIFTEDDNLQSLVRGNHPYVKSKYEAEQLVLQARMQGINGTIYRVGNLIMNSQTHIIQENYEENMFFAHLKAMVDFKVIPDEITQLEVSPVDYTASAIVKLFDKAALSNQTYHVFNPILINLPDVLSYFMDLGKYENSMEEFVEKVLTGLEQSTDMNDHSELCMLYQWWLHQIDETHTTAIRLAQKKTGHILAKLGFQWPTVTPVMFRELMSKISYR